MEIYIRQIWKCKFIKVGSEAYAAELALRNEILRVPLGLDLYAEDLSGESADYHIGAFLRGRLAGCLVLTPLGGGEMKMRQVAVEERYQGMGIGKDLVKCCEVYAGDIGYSRIVLAARRTAAGFYGRLGYKAVSDEFTEVGIPHVKMAKEITIMNREVSS